MAAKSTTNAMAALRGLSDPSIDAMFDVLSHRHRRTVLRILADRGGETPLERLASAIVDGNRSRTDISAELHHVHLPKMVDAGLVKYEADGMVVTPRTDLLTMAALVP